MPDPNRPVVAMDNLTRRYGDVAAVDGITLWVFGGVSHLRDDWGSPGTELRVAIAGPLVTLLLSGLFVGVAFLLVVAIGLATLDLTCFWAFKMRDALPSMALAATSSATVNPNKPSQPKQAEASRPNGAKIGWQP